MMMLDSRGKESTTLTFVSVSWMVLLAKYLSAGVNMGPLGIQPPMTATEFGSAVAMILAIWLGREWTEKKQ